MSLNDGRSKIAKDSLEYHLLLSSPLHDAVRMGKTEQVKYLLQHRADLPPDCIADKSLLHYAVQCDTKERYNLCKFLLEKGANPNDRGRAGSLSPFNMALMDADLGTINLFLEYGADIKSIDQKGEIALYYASRNPNTAVFRHILHQTRLQKVHSASIIRSLSSALYCSARNLDHERCELLLSHGAMVHHRLDYYLYGTPLGVAVMPQPTRTTKEIQTIETLLEYTDADQVRDTRVLTSVTKSYAFKCASECVIRHLVKWEYQNFNIDEADRRIIESRDCYKEFYQKCAQELEDMKRTEFYNGISIFKIYTESRKVISGYARNEELVEALEDEHYEGAFPIYFSSLKKRFGAVVERQKVRNTAAKIVSDVFEFNDSSHPVNQKILGFLDHEDLEFLLLFKR